MAAVISLFVNVFLVSSKSVGARQQEALGKCSDENRDCGLLHSTAFVFYWKGQQHLLQNKFSAQGLPTSLHAQSRKGLWVSTNNGSGCIDLDKGAESKSDIVYIHILSQKDIVSP